MSCWTVCDILFFIGDTIRVCQYSHNADSDRHILQTMSSANLFKLCQSGDKNTEMYSLCIHNWKGNYIFQVWTLCKNNNNSGLIPKDVSNWDFIESSFDFTPAKALKSESPLLFM